MELELKFKIEKDMEPELLAKGFAPAGISHQVDTYYLNGEVLQARKTWLYISENKLKEAFSLDLHQLITNLSTDEREIKLPDRAAAESMHKILEAIGFPFQCVVDKQRRSFTKGNVRVELDEVLGLGSFIEIEIVGPESIENIRKLSSTALELGLDEKNTIYKGYPNLLVDKRFLTNKP